VDGLGVCAIDGTNMGPLARAIVDAAFSLSATSTDLIPRFAAATSRALDSLADAASLVVDVSDPDGLDNPELIADALRAALDALGDVVGEVSPDDVLGRIFSTFCVGK
jgi:tRNA modification GTPase